MKKLSFRKLFLTISLGLLLSITTFAQQGSSVYSQADSLKALVKMNYVYTMEDALSQSRKTGKPIFFNCFADWALPCHGMNGYVFSDKKFCEWMDKNFVCLFMDVTLPENREITAKYDIHTFAHYLVLDQNGEIIHRIVGGARLPEFQDLVKAALSPKTSLRGLEAAYNSGKRDKKTLLNYLIVLNRSNNDSTFQKVFRQYLRLLTEKDYAKKENWFLVQRDVNAVEHPVFQYMLNHRSDFVKSVGEQKVNDLMSRVFGNEMLKFLNSNTEKGESFLDVYTMMQRAGLPENNECYMVYNAIKLHQNHQYLAVLEKLKNFEPQTRYVMETSMKFPNPTEEEKVGLIEYYRERQKACEAIKSSFARFYSDKIAALEQVDGVKFEVSNFESVLSKAANEKKLVFVDCYTSWCGPCKMLTRQTFPDKELGDYFNKKFVSVQIDMEKGEGPALQKKYKVEAFPTLLILDAEGKELHKLMGFRDAKTLLKEVKDLLEK